MVNNKVNLTILLQGSTMLSEGDCSKEVKRPVIIQKGKYSGKQKKDKDGNLVFESVIVPDLDKLDRHSLRVTYRDEELKKKVVDIIHFGTRKCKPAKQVLNICEESYRYMISNEVPEGFVRPHSFIPNKSMLKKGVNATAQAWRIKSPKERLEWHLERIAASMNGKVEDYLILND